MTPKSKQIDWDLATAKKISSRLTVEWIKTKKGYYARGEVFSGGYQLTTPVGPYFFKRSAIKGAKAMAGLGKSRFDR